MDKLDFVMIDGDDYRMFLHGIRNSKKTQEDRGKVFRTKLSGDDFITTFWLKEKKMMCYDFESGTRGVIYVDGLGKPKPEPKPKPTTIDDLKNSLRDMSIPELEKLWSAVQNNIRTATNALIKKTDS